MQPRPPGQQGAPGLPVTSVLRALEKTVAVVPMGMQRGGTRLIWVLGGMGWQPPALPEPEGILPISPWDVSSEIYQTWS